MTRPSSNPLRQAIAAVLIAGLSVCCCQAHFLVHGLSGGEDAAVAARPITAPSCCEDACGDGETPGGDPSDDGPAPVKGCKSCCLKGTGLKDGPKSLHDGVTVSLPAFDLPASDRPPVEIDGTAASCGCGGARLHVEPRTLLRLRCALII